MEKIDYKKQLKAFYHPAANQVTLVDIPPMQFLKVDGSGDPNTSHAFQQATEALFSLSYTLKFMVKQGPLALDYGVMPLEGLWWADDMELFSLDDKAGWKWTLMILQPEFISCEMVPQALEKTAKKNENSMLSALRLESYDEGKAAQIMHIGPFSAEGPTVAKLHAYIDSQGYQRRGLHHEIYLSDIRRAAPDKWKTVIRQPIR